jgi:hypothetical protein
MLHSRQNSQLLRDVINNIVWNWHVKVFDWLPERNISLLCQQRTHVDTKYQKPEVIHYFKFFVIRRKQLSYFTFLSKNFVDTLYVSIAFLFVCALLLTIAENHGWVFSTPALNSRGGVFDSQLGNLSRYRVSFRQMLGQHLKISNDRFFSHTFQFIILIFNMKEYSYIT